MTMDFCDIGFYNRSIHKSVQELVTLKKQKLKIEDMLSRVNSAINKLSTKTIPDLLLEEGINPESFKLSTDEYVLSCKKKYYADISKERKDRALSWLRKNGHGGIIKTNLKIDTGKDEDYLLKAASELKKIGLPYSIEEGVHYQTLRAFVKEQVENGEDIDFEVLGVHIVNEADIKFLGDSQNG